MELNLYTQIDSTVYPCYYRTSNTWFYNNYFQDIIICYNKRANAILNIRNIKRLALNACIYYGHWYHYRQKINDSNVVWFYLCTNLNDVLLKHNLCGWLTYCTNLTSISCSDRLLLFVLVSISQRVRYFHCCKVLNKHRN